MLATRVPFSMFAAHFAAAAYCATGAGQYRAEHGNMVLPAHLLMSAKLMRDSTCSVMVFEALLGEAHCVCGSAAAPPHRRLRRLAMLLRHCAA